MSSTTTTQSSDTLSWRHWIHRIHAPVIGLVCSPTTQQWYRNYISRDSSICEFFNACQWLPVIQSALAGLKIEDYYMKFREISFNLDEDASTTTKARADTLTSTLYVPEISEPLSQTPLPSSSKKTSEEWEKIQLSNEDIVKLIWLSVAESINSLDMTDEAHQFPRNQQELIAAFKNDQEHDRLIPWLNAFEHVIFDLCIENRPTLFETPYNLMAHQEDPFFHRPMSYLCLVMAHENDPLGHLMQMYEYLSQSQNSDDALALKYAILMQDSQLKSDQEVSDLLEKIRTTFGLHSTVLKLNLSEEQKTFSFPAYSSRISKYRAWLEDIPEKELSEYPVSICDADRSRLTNLLHMFVTQSMIPFFQRSIRLHQEQQTQKKQSSVFTSRFLDFGKRYFTKTSSDASIVAEPPSKVPSEQPSHIRLIEHALCCFDYQTAHGLLDQMKKEYQADKYVALFASLQEQLIIIQCLLNMPSNLIESALQQLSTMYLTRISLPFASLRLHLVYFHWLETCHRTKQAADLMLSTAANFANSDMLNGLLLEKVAHLLCRCTQPQTRRAALYMMLAGGKYDHTGLARLSFRIHRILLLLLQPEGFQLAIQRTKLWLARDYFHMGWFRDATRSLLNLLLVDHLPTTQQLGIFREFLFIYQVSLHRCKSRTIPVHSIYVNISQEFLKVEPDALKIVPVALFQVSHVELKISNEEATFAPLLPTKIHRSRDIPSRFIYCTPQGRSGQNIEMSLSIKSWAIRNNSPTLF
jgi:hypothetical protein